MNENKLYQKQVELLLDVLPFIQRLDCFALKGGTAINLFIRDMPRLSIDIDLTYLPIEPRQLFLNNLNEKMNMLATMLEGNHFYVIKKYSKETKQIIKLIVANDVAEIKIEPNTILRGCVFGTEERSLSQKAQDVFLQSQKARLLSIADLYAGKICAALDRQHPRDLFDIKLLFENEGLTDEIRRVFVVYLACSPRPMHELLMPNKLDMRDIYQKEFLGMTNLIVSYDELHETRDQLINAIQNNLTLNEKLFLVSIKEAQPNWELMPLPEIKELPALKWKIINVNKMTQQAKEKSLKSLKAALDI